MAKTNMLERLKEIAFEEDSLESSYINCIINDCQSNPCPCVFIVVTFFVM